MNKCYVSAVGRGSRRHSSKGRRHRTRHHGTSSDTDSSHGRYMSGDYRQRHSRRRHKRRSTSSQSTSPVRHYGLSHVDGRKEKYGAATVKIEHVAEASPAFAEGSYVINRQLAKLIPQDGRKMEKSPSILLLTKTEYLTALGNQCGITKSINSRPGWILRAPM